MGLQFILGIRARRNRGSNPGDSRHFGSVGENIGNWLRRPDGQREKRKAVWSLRS